MRKRIHPKTQKEMPSQPNLNRHPDMEWGYSTFVQYPPGHNHWDTKASMNNWEKKNRNSNIFRDILGELNLITEKPRHAGNDGFQTKTSESQDLITVSRLKICTAQIHEPPEKRIITFFPQEGSITFLDKFISIKPSYLDDTTPIMKPKHNTPFI